MSKDRNGLQSLAVALKIFLVMTLLTGILYPALITGISQITWSNQADGSLITEKGRVMGSSLIGQPFDSAIYFSSRPSAIHYNPLPSGGSNLALTNRKLKSFVQERKESFISANQLDTLITIPSEMLFASASGLDPHISPEAARLQVDRIVKARKWGAGQKQELLKAIDDLSGKPPFFCLGNKTVNVLLLNLTCDQIR